MAATVEAGFKPAPTPCISPVFSDRSARMGKALIIGVAGDRGVEVIDFVADQKL